MFSTCLQKWTFGVSTVGKGEFSGSEEGKWTNEQTEGGSAVVGGGGRVLPSFYFCHPSSSLSSFAHCNVHDTSVIHWKLSKVTFFDAFNSSIHGFLLHLITNSNSKNLNATCVELSEYTVAAIINLRLLPSGKQLTFVNTDLWISPKVWDLTIHPHIGLFPK